MNYEFENKLITNYNNLYDEFVIYLNKTKRQTDVKYYCNLSMYKIKSKNDLCYYTNLNIKNITKQNDYLFNKLLNKFDETINYFENLFNLTKLNYNCVVVHSNKILFKKLKLKLIIKINKLIKKTLNVIMLYKYKFYYTIYYKCKKYDIVNSKMFNDLNKLIKTKFNYDYNLIQNFKKHNL